MTYVALIDCNNFFVSCERVFNPKLDNKPVVVLSSNDGCVISRSNEAKKLGVPMGAAAYQYESVFKKYNVAVFSSNFSLYREISRRIMQILKELNNKIEIYSVDEAFLFLDNIKESMLEPYLKDIKEKIYCYTGIPISIGVSVTKTLAKTANKFAKKEMGRQGICYLSLKSADSQLLKLEVGDLWGIGRRLAKKLRYHGILTAFDLKYANDEWLRTKFSIQVLRVAMELRGINCSHFAEIETSQKTMVYSRSFGNYVYTLKELSEVASDYASTLARKLRKENLVAGALEVWITTNRFSDTPCYSSSGTYNFQIPSAYTFELIVAAQNILERIYQENYAYNKLAVMAYNLSLQSAKQLSLLEIKRDLEKEKNLMKAVDSLNYRYGKKGIFYASSGINHNWKTLELKRSPCFMSDWNELLLVQA